MHEHAHQPVLITGGAGFLGTNIAAAAHGQDVFDDLSRPHVDGNAGLGTFIDIQDRRPEPLACLEHAP